MANQLQRTHPLQTRLQSLEQLPDGFQVITDPFLTMTNLRFQHGGPATAAVTAVLGVTPPSQPNTWVRGDAGSVIWLVRSARRSPVVVMTASESALGESWPM